MRPALSTMGAIHDRGLTCAIQGGRTCASNLKIRPQHRLGVRQSSASARSASPNERSLDFIQVGPVDTPIEPRSSRAGGWTSRPVVTTSMAWRPRTARFQAGCESPRFCPPVRRSDWPCGWRRRGTASRRGSSIRMRPRFIRRRIQQQPAGTLVGLCPRRGGSYDQHGILAARPARPAAAAGIPAAGRQVGHGEGRWHD